MQTIKLYDKSPYETSFKATVQSVMPGKKEGTLFVVLDQTLFFPEEGGQTPDQGFLQCIPVIDVQIDKNQVITHTLDISGTGVILHEGDAVTGQIDWDHRFSNMQNHSGEHILSGLLHTLYGYENVGFRLSDNTVTLDTSGQLSDQQILDLERRANEVVYQNLPIYCEYPDAETLAAMDYRSKKAIDGAVRIVTIEGIDRCACCAPHVRRTGEIGSIRIISVLHNKADMRLTIVCGRRAIADAQMRQAQLARISHLTNLPQESASDGVQHLLDDIAGCKEQIKALEAQYVSARVQQILQDAPSVMTKDRDLWIFESALSAGAQRSMVNQLCEQDFRFVGVFAESANGGFTYIIGSRADDARTPNAALKEKLAARGGGKPMMVTGSVAATKNEIEAALR